MLETKNEFKYGSETINAIDEWATRHMSANTDENVLAVIANETVKSFGFLGSAAANSSDAQVLEDDADQGSEKVSKELAEKALKARLDFMLFLASKNEDLHIDKHIVKSLFMTYGACDALLSWFKSLLPKTMLLVRKAARTRIGMTSTIGARARTSSPTTPSRH